MPTYKQLIAELRAEYEASEAVEEKKSALDDRLGLQKLKMASIAERAMDLGHPLTDIAKDAGIRYALLDRWVTTHLNHPEDKRPKDVIVSFSVLEELDGPDRFEQMAELVKMAKGRAKPGKKPRIIVNDIRELQGKKLTRYAPPPRTPQEKIAAMREWMNEPEIAKDAARDTDTRLAFQTAVGQTARETAELTDQRERSGGFSHLRDAAGTWDAHLKLEKAVHYVQQAYDEYVDLGQMPDEERSRAKALLSRLQLAVSYMESFIDGGQPLDKALADLLGEEAL